jgi:hypothetical protein
MRPWVWAVLVVGAVLLVACLGGCGESNSGSSYGDNPANYSVAYKLAVIDGDPSEEEAFQSAIDCIMGSDIKGAETEVKVGDTLVASWEQSGKQDSLLEWAQAFC